MNLISGRDIIEDLKERIRKGEDLKILLEEALGWIEGVEEEEEYRKGEEEEENFVVLWGMKEEEE